MNILAYCQELDPVAGKLRDTLSQYMQVLQVPTATLESHSKQPSSYFGQNMTLRNCFDQDKDQAQDLVDLLLAVPARPVGPTKTSLDLLELICQPFGSANEPRSYKMPRALGAMPREPWLQDLASMQNADAWMPFGWQRYHSSATFTSKASTLALTKAQQEMSKAGVGCFM